MTPRKVTIIGNMVAQVNSSQEAAWFSTTHWSVVLAAGDPTSPDASSALSQLCSAYWYPIYAYVRRQGRSPHDAQDLTQEFFARLLERNSLEGVAQAKGKFRSFLLASLNHFLADEWDRSRRQKRGGGIPLLSLDDQTAEERYRLEPVDELTAEKIYERRWACTLLEQVLARLSAESAAAGKTAQFAELKTFLPGDEGSGSYPEVAARLGLTEGAVRVAVHRMRQRYGELFRVEIAHTVASPNEIDEEINHLLAVLSG